MAKAGLKKDGTLKKGFKYKKGGAIVPVKAKPAKRVKKRSTKKKK